MILTVDQQTILCADKFGDVYAFQMHSPPVQRDEGGEAIAIESKPKQSDEARSKPSASELTVHTKKNRETLRNQLMQSKLNDKGNKKRRVEYKPILGHVSLLTDVASTTIDSDTGEHSYILTADRDEHIRVSRGLPQAHIIEGFCLGHQQFVSRLCLPDWAPKLLISGGGDDCLLVWHWLSGECIAEVPLREFVKSAIGQQAPIAVSGLWALPLPEQGGAIVVSLEGVPGLFIFCIDEDGIISNIQTIKVPSNILDVAVIPSQAAILWTVDSIHQPGSTKDCREAQHDIHVGMHLWSSSRKQWDQILSSEAPLSGIEGWISRNSPEESLAAGDLGKYRELYYGIEHLRKTSAEDREPI
jgi:tRNA (guanine-N(7)-)-methyltransferase subunit TRM82